MTITKNQFSPFKLSGGVIQTKNSSWNFQLLDDQKLLLGTGSDGEIYVNSDDLYIRNVTQDKDIILNVNDGGVDTEVMRIDGATGNVGFWGTPTNALHLFRRNIQIESDNLGATTFNFLNYESGGDPLNFFNARSAGGTKASPAAVGDDKLIFRVGGSAYNGTSFPSNRGQIEIRTKGLWSATNYGTLIRVQGTSENSTTLTEWARFTEAKLGIMTTTPAAVLDVVGDTRLGDSSTNYMEIEDGANVGDVNFVGGAGLQFGEIYYHDGGFNTALAAQDTYYQIVGFNTNSLSNGSCVPDYTNAHITVGKAGVYFVSLTISSRSAVANNYEFHVFKNNGATEFVNVGVHRTTSVANRIGHGHGGGFIDCDANDTIEVWVLRTDGGAVSKTITIEHITLSVVQIGGT